MHPPLSSSRLNMIIFYIFVVCEKKPIQKAPNQQWIDPGSKFFLVFPKSNSLSLRAISCCCCPKTFSKPINEAQCCIDVPPLPGCFILSQSHMHHLSCHNFSGTKSTGIILALVARLSNVWQNSEISLWKRISCTSLWDLLYVIKGENNGLAAMGLHRICLQ